MEQLEFKKLLLEIGDGIVKSSIKSLSERYGVPINELNDLATMSRLVGRMQTSLEIEEMVLNGFKEIKED